MSERVFIGLGSNLGDSARILLRATECIAQLPQTRLIRQSGLYISPAWGGIEQPDYTNAVLEIETSLEPDALLNELLAIERNNGRIRLNEMRWGPRVLDCDILLFGKRRLQTANLTLPHPRMGERAFVLMPLAEIAPDLVIPNLGGLSSLIQHLDNVSIARLEQGSDHVHQ
jgi:2-amino-4-hydroxy-6-hydroxymethyldihydropteridine diphosphokinase